MTKKQVGPTSRRTSTMLNRAKKDLKLFALDYDGTLVASGSDLYTIDSAKSCMQEIINHFASLVIISARAATGYQILVPVLQKLLQPVDRSPHVYFAGGNGTMMYRIFPKKTERIYCHNIPLEIVQQIIQEVNRIYKEEHIEANKLNSNGLRMFLQMKAQSWDKIINPQVLSASRPYPWCFAEDVKISIVLPQTIKQHSALLDKLVQIIKNLEQTHDIHLQISRGDETFAHITRSFEGKDPKLAALEHVMAELVLNDNQVVVIGDMPDGNDKGILVDSDFPYTFTNSQKHQIPQGVFLSKPYPLLDRYSDQQLHPIETVYRAIHFLLTR
ncbi:HAD hydrolase family protein [Candidatus Woesebacteria bacterium]|nr:HAD hydrolase family protein [Candidatus Woesebacteria bacterium]